MAYSREDLLSALEKVGSIEFTEAEAEAMADLFAQDEVEGFMPTRRVELDHVGNFNFRVEIDGVDAGSFRLGYTATDDLWQ